MNNNNNNNSNISQGSIEIMNNELPSENPNSRNELYTEDQWNEKIKVYPWLKSENGNLGCLICSTVSSLHAFKSIGVAISPEWRDYKVLVAGKNDIDRRKNICKKISKYQLSDAHIRATEVSRENAKSHLPNLIDRMNSERINSTMRIFRTAYYIAKNNRPFSDHTRLVDLQQLNEIDLGLSLHSR